MQGQDNVTIGIGEPGLDNSVVVLVLAAEGEAGADGLEGIRCFPGTALAGRRRLVSAAAHSLILSRIGLTGDPEGRVEVWVLRAARFLELNPQDFDKEMLRSRGAVRARAQHSRVKDEHIADRDNVHNSIPRGIDTVYLELYEDLELPPNQPRILKVNEAVQMAGYLGSPGISASYLEMVINGMGDHYSTGNRGEPGEAMAVQWQPVTPGKWMFSRTNMAAAGALSSSLSKALKGCRQPGICGVLELKDIWCPGGFSGGGAYVKVPAVALDPNSGPGAEGNFPAHKHGALSLRMGVDIEAYGCIRLSTTLPCAWL